VYGLECPFERIWQVWPLGLRRPRNARCVEPGLSYHVTQRGTNRQRVFYSPGDYAMYLALARDQLQDAACRVLGYCLMSHHVHWIVVPEREDSLAVLFRRVHGRYSQYVNTRRRRRGHLWQQRYYSCPLADSHQWVALKYVEQNPCRASMVKSPEQYRWSSAAAHCGVTADRTGVLDLEYWRRAGGAETWRQLHGIGEVADQLMLLRRCTYAGRPFGDEEFVGRPEQRLQRHWRRWGFEKPAAVGQN
jgi:putative transposase